MSTPIGPTDACNRSDSRSWSRIVAVSGALMVAAIVALSVDLPIARWVVEGHCPRSLHSFLEMNEGFGHGGGIALILLAAWLLDPNGRARLLRILTAVLAAGLSADLLKMCVARIRPRDFDFHSTNVFDTFVNWLPLAGNRSGAQGFPSAHTATAVALALALAWAYPRARWLFASLAVIVAMQRAECAAHFLSDVLVGAAVGYLAGSAMLRGDALFGALGWIEARAFHATARQEARPDAIVNAERRAA